MRADRRWLSNISRNPADQSGMSLVEVLIVMVILSLVLLTTLYATKQSWSGVTSSVKKNDAAIMIGEQIEQMKFRIAAHPATSFPPLDSSAAAGNGVTVSWVVDNTTIPAVDARKVTFTATWMNGIRQQTLVVPTYVAKNY